MYLWVLLLAFYKWSLNKFYFEEAMHNKTINYYMNTEKIFFSGREDCKAINKILFITFKCL